MTTLRDKHRIHNDAVDAVIDNLAGGQTVAIPQGNTAVSRLLQRFAVIRMARYRLEKIHDTLRAQVSAQLPVPPAPGQYMIYDNGYVNCIAAVRGVPGRIDEGLLIDTLMTQHKLTAKQANTVLDKCRVPATLVTELTVTLKK
eukprot:GHVU01169116.1.p1 GENE.GHVU01169116.1~~GHVU01169116.1.p1  ORF type:complete len:143 (-),score=11.57 GHVU01169116.1:274-702(-)